MALIILVKIILALFISAIFLIAFIKYHLNMTVKELKQILDKYSDDALVGVSIKTELNVSFTLKEDTFYNNLILIAE